MINTTERPERDFLINPWKLIESYENSELSKDECENLFRNYEGLFRKIMGDELGGNIVEYSRDFCHSISLYTGDSDIIPFAHMFILREWSLVLEKRVRDKLQQGKKKGMGGD